MDEFHSQIKIGSDEYHREYVLNRRLLKVNFNGNGQSINGQSINEDLQEPSSNNDVVSNHKNMLEIIENLHLHLIEPNQDSSLLDYSSKLLNTSNKKDVILPIYTEPTRGLESAIVPLPNRIVCKFKDGKSEYMINYLKNEFRLVHNVTLSDLIRPFFYFSFEPGYSENYERDVGHLFDIEQKLKSIVDVEIVELEWMKLRSLSSFIPDDPLWPYQWNLTSLNMSGAWDLQVGDESTYVAVIDMGFDLDHPDLVFSSNDDPDFTHCNMEQVVNGLSPPYDAHDNSIIGAHGTAVAGVIAAQLNNKIGIAGISGGSKIMPIRIPTRTPGIISGAIEWAIRMGAKVINLSMSATPSATLMAKIDEAWSAGVIICAAAGNNGGDTSSYPVDFPASHKNVIAVGALDMNDMRKRHSSPDTECWGSSFGEGLNVMAPGVQCWTTDIQGIGGWNDSNGGPVTLECVDYGSCGDTSGDYISLFNGTSCACAHVSGLAALLFSRYPKMSNIFVREIIEKTCIKVNSSDYVYIELDRYSNGTWNQQMGYGKIDPVGALSYADTYAKISKIPTKRK